MKTYHCKHAVEALRWTDTDANRELFATWFEKHDVRFETRGNEISMPDFDDVALEGTWVVFSDGAFLVMEDEAFHDMYVEAVNTFVSFEGAKVAADAEIRVTRLGEKGPFYASIKGVEQAPGKKTFTLDLTQYELDWLKTSTRTGRRGDPCKDDPDLEATILAVDALIDALAWEST